MHLDNVIGTDSTKLIVQGIRQHLGDHPRWRELEAVVYETLKEFEMLPDAQLLLRLPKSLSDSQKAEISRTVTEAMAAYGRECRDTLLAPLLQARIQLYLIEHDELRAAASK